MFKRMFEAKTRGSVVAIEGQIGSGKSSFLNEFRGKEGFRVDFEPVSEWQSVNGRYNLLDMYYKDAARYSYLFQSYVAVSNARRNILAPPRTTVLAERLLGQRAFAELLYEEEKLTGAEYYTLNQITQSLEKSLPQPDLVIYMRCNTSVALQRIQRRGRAEESQITEDYLARVAAMHDKHFISRAPLLDCPVWVVNCEQNAAEMSGLFKTFGKRMQKQDFGAKKLHYF